MKARTLALALLLAFGALRLGFEQRLTEQHRLAFFRTAKLDLGMRERLGQMGFVAALSGFRAMVADLEWLRAHTAWENTAWARVYRHCDTATSLQPRCEMFWDVSAWHMAWNASVAAYEDRNQPREALRLKAQREYWKLGEDFFLRGIQNNPDRPLLYDRLGMFYREKTHDHAKAFAAYEKGASLPGAKEYMRRFAAFELAQVPGREREAYDRLIALYKIGESERLPTLLRLLRDLEPKLNVPAEQRIPPPPPRNKP